MITIVGTGHIFDLSSRIYRLVQGLGPEVVAVELDKKRHRILETERRNRERGIYTEVSLRMLFRPSPVPFRYRLLAYFQRKFAAANNVLPGEEMLSAIDAARSIGAKIALIDRDINKTLRSFNNAMSLFEKLKFYSALITGLSGLGIRKETIGGQIERIEKDYDSVILEIGEQFPGLKRALIDERDRHMTLALMDLNRTFESILAFVGDAHVEGIKRLLEKNGIHPETIHLHSFMHHMAPQGTHSVNFSIN
ncbi:MAG: TraB/GumN family protein [Thermoplasmata archaeon]|nr:TraB/GumN family protein [Thermoplasmata archaeon]